MLSILIPTYNFNITKLVGELHYQAMENYVDFEIIVMEDGYGYFLDEKEFDSGVNSEFGLFQVIEGWQIGIPKFGKGGKGKLLVPSRLGYGSKARGSIPANSTLIFDIELLDWR